MSNHGDSSPRHQRIRHHIQVGAVRAPGCDIQLGHSTISRRHALLCLDGGLAIADLGSANGTKVCGHKLQPGVPVQIRQGELIELGSVGVLVQGRSRVPHLWTHSYFEDRADNE